MSGSSSTTKMVSGTPLRSLSVRGAARRDRSEPARGRRRIRLREDTRCGDENRGAGLDRPPGVVALDPAVDLERDIEAMAVDLGPSGLELAVHLFVERLVRPAGPDAHQHHVIDRVEVREYRLDGRLEIEREADARPPARGARASRGGGGGRGAGGVGCQ